MTGYSIEDMALGPDRKIISLYRDGTQWRWRAYVRDRATDAVMAESSGAHQVEQGALAQAEAWLKAWRRW